MFGAIDAALKATEEVAAAGALLTQPGEPAPSAATSQGAASPGSSQSAAASDKLYGSSPEKASKAQPAGASPPTDDSMAGPQDEQPASPGLGAHDHAAADSAGEDCSIQDCVQVALTCVSEGPWLPIGGKERPRQYVISAAAQIAGQLKDLLGSLGCMCCNSTL